MKLAGSNSYSYWYQTLVKIPETLQILVAHLILETLLTTSAIILDLKADCKIMHKPQKTATPSIL